MYNYYSVHRFYRFWATSYVRLHNVIFKKCTLQDNLTIVGREDLAGVAMTPIVEGSWGPELPPL